jgi:lipopolysaccharide/colanic/teichoic acid biosynthesis glycosyltransferase
LAGKRLFDFLFSFLLVIFIGWIIIILWIIASLETKSNGFFFQNRIGKYGERFTIFKIKTISSKTGHISNFGKLLRKSKLDELPQLFNVLKGEMSVVGPRPDIPGYYDQLQGEARKLLTLKPGLTSTASLKYANEEELLSRQENPLRYNDTVIFPDKVQMNLEYYYNHSFYGDIKIIFKTILRYIE